MTSGRISALLRRRRRRLLVLVRCTIRLLLRLVRRGDCFRGCLFCLRRRRRRRRSHLKSSPVSEPSHQPSAHLFPPPAPSPPPPLPQQHLPTPYLVYLK